MLAQGDGDGFDDCTASQASFADQAALFVARHPEFSGEIFGFKADGEMQISTTDAAGWLGYAGRSRWGDVAMRIRAKRPRRMDAQAARLKAGVRLQRNRHP